MKDLNGRASEVGKGGDKLEDLKNILKGNKVSTAI